MDCSEKHSLGGKGIRTGHKHKSTNPTIHCSPILESQNNSKGKTQTRSLYALLFYSSSGRHGKSRLKPFSCLIPKLRNREQGFSSSTSLLTCSFSAQQADDEQRTRKKTTAHNPISASQCIAFLAYQNNKSKSDNPQRIFHGNI